MRGFIIAFSFLLLVSLACNAGQQVPPTPQNSIFDSGRTAYGFFPSPPEVSVKSVLQHYKDMSAHGDFVLIQQNTAWEDFVSGPDGESQTRTDLINQVKLARQNIISLYNEIYALVKAEVPETKIFVTFQWDDLNNMFPQPEEGNRQKLDTNWEQVEAFEPNLDLWVISTYPYFIFNNGAQIPTDYYTPLFSQTSKPLAIAEGGFSSQAVGPMNVSAEDQVEFLQAIHNQLGPRLAFWVNTLLNDFNLDSYAKQMKKDGRDPEDATSLAAFAHIGLRHANGTPKPALEVWDGFRN